METDNDIKYLMGKMCGAMEAIQTDIAEIRQSVIPDGVKRMQDAEDSLENLRVWKNSVVTIGVLIGAGVSWLVAKWHQLEGIING